MIKQDNCTDKNCPNYGRYSRYCSHVSGSYTPPKPIAKRSEKLDKIMRKEYVPEVKEMIEKGTLCAVNSPVCTKKAQGWHHLQGRGKNLFKKRVPCCNPCNGFIEQNDLWARNNGWKISKFKKDAA
jgi:hypothetical protein